MTNTKSSCKSQDLNAYEQFAAEHDGAKWETALATAGCTGDNIERLRPPNTTPVLQAAMTLAIFRGWKVFPARMEGGKKWSYLAAKYAPGGENWGATNDPEQLRQNFNDHKWRLKCGVGVPTGADNGIFVVENDTIKGHNVDGLKELEALEKKHGKLPLALTSKTPSDSIHRYFKHPGGGIKLKSMSIAAGVDVKADGGMVVAPPSKRSDGKYKWLNNAPIAEAPEWLIEMIRDSSPTRASPTDRNDPWEHGVYEPLTEEEKTVGCIAIRDHLPNEDDDFDTWNTNGMKIFHTVPDERGFEAFDGYSQRAPDKYNIKIKTADKWAAYFKSPPTDLTDGSFIYLVNKAIGVGWRDRIADEKKPPESKTNEQTSSREKAYAAEALGKVANELRDTPKDERDFYECAFHLGTMVAREWIARDVVKRELENAAKVYGLEAWARRSSRLASTKE